MSMARLAFVELNGAACCLALAVCSGTAVAKDGPKAGAAVVYEAQHGDWTVNCDPCAPMDDSVCMMWPNSDVAGLNVYPIGEQDEAKPLIAMSFHPGGNLAYLSEGTLVVSIDGAPSTTIRPPDIAYDELYASMFIQAHAASGLLPAMRDGTAATFEYTDADGSRSSEISLNGFGSALDDMLGMLPYPRGNYEPGHPDSCPE